jgi:hypothetical protein
MCEVFGQGWVKDGPYQLGKGHVIFLFRKGTPPQIIDDVIKMYIP